MRGKEVYNISKSPVRRFFRRTAEWLSILFAIGKRLAMIGLISWGGIRYLTQSGRRSISEGLKAHTIETGIGRQFMEGIQIIKESMRVRSPEERAAEQKRLEDLRKHREEFREELLRCGVDPDIHYIRRGDPGYEEELEFQRNLRKDLSR